MKYHSVMEYLRYNNLEEEHPELVRLYREERNEYDDTLDQLNERIHILEECICD